MQRLKKTISSKTFWVCTMFLVLNVALTHHALLAMSPKTKILIIGATTLVELLLVGAVLIGCKKELPLEKLFLLVMIPLGLLFMVAMPSGESPDDLTHYYRIYGITEGLIDVPSVGENANGSFAPVKARSFFSINPKPGNYSKILSVVGDNHGEEKEFVAYPASAIYNPICYFPQIVGVTIGKIFNNVLVEAYLARFFNFGFFVLLVFWAIKKTPAGKMALFLLALLPSSLQEATSLSPDALTIGMSIFFISFVLRLWKNKKDIAKRDLVVLGISALILSLCKIVYVPILFTMFMIPASRFGGRKYKIIKLLAILTIVAVVNISWLYLAGKHLTEIRDGVNGTGQVKYVLTHPLAYLRILISSLAINARFYIVSGLGGLLGPLMIELPEIYMMILYPLAIYVVWKDSADVVIERKNKYIVLSVLVSVIGLIFTALYVQWTPVAGQSIEGVQGRYLLPVIPLVPIALGKTKNVRMKLRKKRKQPTLLVLVFVDMCAIVYVIAANL